MLWINNDKFTAIVFGCCLLFSTIVLNFVVLLFSESTRYVGLRRKLVFVVGLCLLGAINFIHGTVKVVDSETDTTHITLVYLFFCVYQSTIGPFYWVYIPEVLKIKDINYPMACLWGVQFITAITFTFKSHGQGDTAFYYIFSIFCLISAALIQKFAVETQGRPWASISPLLCNV